MKHPILPGPNMFADCARDLADLEVVPAGSHPASGMPYVLLPNGQIVTTAKALLDWMSGRLQRELEAELTRRNRPTAPPPPPPAPPSEELG